jgi:Mrp family chromosome partitioning ATPase/capsular polysaccharide biosynthesis protein
MKPGGYVMPSEPHLQELLSILYRWRRFIVTTVVTGFVLAFIVILLTPDQYTGKAQIVFEPQQAYSAVEKATNSPLDIEAAFQTHLTALISRAHLTRVLDSLSADAQGSKLTNSTIRSPTIKPENQSKMEQARRLDRFESHVRVYQEGSSHIIAVVFAGTSPDQAAMVANRIAQLYLDDEQKRKHARISEALNWIDGQVRQIRAGLEGAQLGRDSAAAGQVYEALLKRREQLHMEEEVRSPDLRILSLASPLERPSSHNPLLFVVPCLVIFLIGGSLVAIALDRLDWRLHSVHEVSDAFGIPCIGLVPLIESGGKLRPHEHLLESPRAHYAEAIRSLLAATQLTVAGTVAKIISISSSVRGEGKTALSLSIAAYAALIGRRTLIIDLDCREPPARQSPHQTEINDLDALGINDLIAIGQIQRAEGLNFDYLALHCRPGDPSGDPLLPFIGGDLARLLTQLRESYDCILLDGPPLLGAAQARLLALMADQVLLAVKWGSTERAVAQDVTSLLRELGPAGGSKGTTVAAVLTQVDLEKYLSYRYDGWETIRAISRSATAKRKWRDYLTKIARYRALLTHTGKLCRAAIRYISGSRVGRGLRFGVLQRFRNG